MNAVEPVSETASAARPRRDPNLRAGAGAYPPPRLASTMKSVPPRIRRGFGVHHKPGATIGPPRP